MNLKIMFLGSGSAFTLAEENYQSNILISKEFENQELLDNDDINDGKQIKRFLYDAGSTISEALNRVGLIPQDLDSIYISHLHDDHAGGVPYIALKTYFEIFKFGLTQFGSMKAKLYGHTDILREGWDTCWKGGLEIIQSNTNTLENYFVSNYMMDDEQINFYGTIIKPIQMIHVVSDRRVMPSYGIVIEENKFNVFITGDSVYAPKRLKHIYKKANLIFQDCEFANYMGGVHAQFHQLCELPNDIKKKMWLYHYSLNDNTFVELEKKVSVNGFAGLVKRGQEFNIKG